MIKCYGIHTKQKHSQKGMQYTVKKWHVVQRLMNIKGRRNSRNRFFDEIGRKNRPQL